MSQDGVDTDTVPVPIDRYHDRGPQRGGRKRVIAATCLCRQREGEEDPSVSVIFGARARGY